MDKNTVKKQRLIHNFPVGYVQVNLTVVSEAYSVRKSPSATKRCVDCLCKCGNIAQVSVSQIASGKAKSCGCLSRAALERNVSKYEAGSRAVLRVYEYSAKERGLEFNVVPCCFICNKMKGVLNEGEFMEHLNKIFTRAA